MTGGSQQQQPQMQQQRQPEANGGMRHPLPGRFEHNSMDSGRREANGYMHMVSDPLAMTFHQAALLLELVVPMRILGDSGQLQV